MFNTYKQHKNKNWWPAVWLPKSFLILIVFCIVHTYWQTHSHKLNLVKTHPSDTFQLWTLNSLLVCWTNQSPSAFNPQVLKMCCTSGGPEFLTGPLHMHMLTLKKLNMQVVFLTRRLHSWLGSLSVPVSLALVIYTVRESGQLTVS